MPDDLRRLYNARIAAQSRPAVMPDVYTEVWLEGADIAPIQWLVPGVIPIGGYTVMAGAPKVGKSWAMWDLCLGATRPDRQWLGLPVTQGDVLYLALEDSPRRAQDRLGKLRDEGDQPSAHLAICHDWPRVGEGFEENLARWKSVTPNAKLLIVDTLQKVRPAIRSTGSTYAEDVEFHSALATMARDHDIAIVGVTHVKKGKADDELEMITGSTGVTGSADSILIARRLRGDSEATLLITGRDVEEQNLAITFKDFRWQVLGDAGLFLLNQNQRAILDVLKTTPGLTPSQVAPLVSLPSSRVKKLLWEMGNKTPPLVYSDSGKYFVAA